MNQIRQPIRMSQNEILWAVETLLYAKRYDDANPDVGFPPSDESLLNDVTPKGITIHPEDQKLIFIKIKQKNSNE